MRSSPKTRSSEGSNRNEGARGPSPHALEPCSAPLPALPSVGRALRARMVEVQAD